MLSERQNTRLEKATEHKTLAIRARGEAQPTTNDVVIAMKMSLRVR